MPRAETTSPLLPSIAVSGTEAALNKLLSVDTHPEHRQACSYLSKRGERVTCLCVRCTSDQRFSLTLADMSVPRTSPFRPDTTKGL